MDECNFIYFSWPPSDETDTILILQMGKLKLWDCKSLVQGQKLQLNLSFCHQNIMHVPGMISYFWRPGEDKDRK